jgi:hypothetical protein
MSRLGAPLVALLVAVLLLAGVVVLATGDGPSAYTVGKHEVSQSAVDAELEVLADNRDFAASLVGAEVVEAKGSVPASLSAGWLTFRIVTTFATDELARMGGEVTAEDRAATGLTNVTGFRELPADLRRQLSSGFASLRALQRSLEAEPSGAVQDAVRAACPSGRFVSHILVETQAQASDLAAQLAGGADFGELAAEFSTDPGSGQQGGLLGCIDELGDAVAPFLAAAEAAPVDVVTAPVETEFGFHLILVTGPTPSDLDAASIGIVLRRAARASVEVDPRYGSWDPTTAQVVPARATDATG